MLPDVDGFEVSRRLREAGRWSPVLMLTARNAVADRVSGLDAGADDYLTKPFSFAELLARARSCGAGPPNDPRSCGSATWSSTRRPGAWRATGARST